MTRPNVLITGCSLGGVGEALALEFASQGYHVFASVRDISKAEHLSGRDGIDIIQMDVTSPDSIALAFKKICSLSGCKEDTFELDVLVNNAGMGSTAPIMEQDLAELRQVFEVNVFGVVAVTQAFKMPLVRSRGKVVNIASVAGILPSPFFGAYSGSKAAITSISETLRLELAPLGLSVMTVMLATVKSQFFVNNNWSDLAPDSLYKPFEASYKKVVKGEYAGNGESAASVAKSLVADVKGNAVGQVWRGAGAQLGRTFGYHFPGSWLHAMTLKIYGLNLVPTETSKRV